MGDILPFTHDDAGPTLSEFVNRTIAKWRAAFPLTYQHGVEVLYDYIDWKLGRRDLDFAVAANKRAIDAMVLLYDLCTNDDEKRELRKYFRLIVRRHKGRLAPYYPMLHASMRIRLREHKMYVMCRLDPPDPDERRKGRR